MIEQLMVRDYVLFDEGRIDFSNGMSAITGETGAGKSLLIDALGYLSGDRLPGTIVKKDAERAVLQMVLSDVPESVKTLLDENGFEPADELIISRIINSGNKSRMSINGQSATNAFVKKVVSRMIDVHSQTDTLTLMDPMVQMDMLDRYASTETERDAVSAAFSVYQKAALDLKRLEKETFSKAELDAVTESMNEIKSAKAKKGELEELQEQIKDASQIEQNRQDLAALNTLYSRSGGIQESLYEALSIAQSNPKLEKQAEKINDLYYSLEDVFDQISAMKETLDAGGMSLDELNDREYFLKRLYRKYGGSYEGMMEEYNRLNERVSRILNRQELRGNLLKTLAAAKKDYETKAAALHEKRAAVTEELSLKVQENARDLMLENCLFKIELTPKKASRDGMDLVEFKVRMNPGQPFSLLSESASGGELSRLMLALKVVFQAQDGISTLVFDEIDTGVSGRVAMAMGSKMKQLAKDYQVLCITHLPAVAVWADEQYEVSKSSYRDVTAASIRRLNHEESIEALAMMSAGRKDENTLQAMEDLYQEAHHG